ncbi:hypothetical protein NUW54_g14007 [Trametes sanguinea]|uniref:Uncharacterized protein n=1 Tax=Trametes sanguinea TaxID=158606 RepID=A0ACC1MHM8_9APHY|nr:hypothetical protein NUW54_g14007 [Trametes sanguinea]
MFVVFTADDAIQTYTLDAVNQFLAHRKNPNGCQPKITYYTSLNYTNYTLVTDWYVAGNEIADHTLSPELWSYDDFVRENAWKWVGRGEVDEYYVEVDRRREMDGKTLQTAIVNVGNGTEAAEDGKAVVAEVRQ